MSSELDDEKSKATNGIDLKRPREIMEIFPSRSPDGQGRQQKKKPSGVMHEIGNVTKLTFYFRLLLDSLRAEWLKRLRCAIERRSLEGSIFAFSAKLNNAFVSHRANVAIKTIAVNVHGLISSVRSSPRKVFSISLKQNSKHTKVSCETDNSLFKQDFSRFSMSLLRMMDGDDYMWMSKPGWTARIDPSDDAAVIQFSFDQLLQNQIFSPPSVRTVEWKISI